MTTLLVDGDIVAYQAATANEHTIDWGDGLWTLHSFADEVYQYAENMITTLLSQAGCSNALILLTDGPVFRKDVDPEYKANRIGKRKPVCLPQVRKMMVSNMKTMSTDGLEADDLIGIFATKSPKDYIVWSPDKDLRQIAGSHLIDGKVITITEEEGERSFWMQVLTGDTADNYKGCIGVGPVKAEKVLDADDGLTVWQKVVKAYEKAGQTEEDAIVTARLAHILTFKTKDTVWSPPDD